MDFVFALQTMLWYGLCFCFNFHMLSEAWCAFEMCIMVVAFVRIIVRLSDEDTVRGGHQPMQEPLRPLGPLPPAPLRPLLPAPVQHPPPQWNELHTALNNCGWALADTLMIDMASAPGLRHGVASLVLLLRPPRRSSTPTLQICFSHILCRA